MVEPAGSLTTTVQRVEVNPNIIICICTEIKIPMLECRRCSDGNFARWLPAALLLLISLPPILTWVEPAFLCSLSANTSRLRAMSIISTRYNSSIKLTLLMDVSSRLLSDRLSSASCYWHVALSIHYSNFPSACFQLFPGCCFSCSP